MSDKICLRAVNKLTCFIKTLLIFSFYYISFLYLQNPIDMSINVLNLCRLISDMTTHVLDTFSQVYQISWHFDDYSTNFNMLPAMMGICSRHTPILLYMFDTYQDTSKMSRHFKAVSWHVEKPSRFLQVCFWCFPGIAIYSQTYSRRDKDMSRHL